MSDRIKVTPYYDDYTKCKISAMSSSFDYTMADINNEIEKDRDKLYKSQLEWLKQKYPNLGPEELKEKHDLIYGKVIDTPKKTVAEAQKTFEYHLINMIATYGVYRGVGGQKKADTQEETLRNIKIPDSLKVYEYYIEYYIKYLLRILRQDTTYKRELRAFVGKEFRVLQDFKGSFGDMVVLREVFTKGVLAKTGMNLNTSLEIFRRSEEILMTHATDKVKNNYKLALAYKINK